MPRSTSTHPDTKKSDEWVVVGTFGLDHEADICVSLLKGSRIPAVRFPMLHSVMAEFPEPIRVLVPPDREAEARELVGEGS